MVPPSLAPLLIVLGTFGPFFAAVGMVARTSGFRGLGAFLGQAFRWRVGIQWYAAAFLAPFLIRIVVLYVHILKGGTVPDMSDTTRWLALPTTFLLVLLIGGLLMVLGDICMGAADCWALFVRTQLLVFQVLHPAA